jgi:hypothetical protein
MKKDPWITPRRMRGRQRERRRELLDPSDALPTGSRVSQNPCSCCPLPLFDAFSVATLGPQHTPVSNAQADATA